nr:hypothetical protein [Tanacetum cinerariifolium]
PSANQEVTAQVDYQTPTGKNQLLEAGAKEISRTVRSDYSYYGQLARTQADNSFRYNQNVASGYLAYTAALPGNITLKPGVRYEYTGITADYGSGSVGDIPNYGILVPSVSLLYKLPNGNALRLAYNRRIQRPSLQFLNPNLQAANPLIQTLGNPLLRPEYTSNYELGYSTFLKQANLSFSAFARTTNGSIQSPQRGCGCLLRRAAQQRGRPYLCGAQCGPGCGRAAVWQLCPAQRVGIAGVWLLPRAAGAAARLPEQLCAVQLQSQARRGAEERQLGP